MRLVKICGIKTPEAYEAARAAGADLVGFNFYPRSPRAVTPAEAASIVGDAGGLIRVALFVDPPDALLEGVFAIFRPDMVQLHGAETPARVAEIREKFALPVMKVFGIGDAADLLRAEAEQGAADWVMLDSKPSAAATLPGGNAESFDWALLRGARLEKPWLLAGGLTPENVADAIAIADPTGVDVSSGVERARGVKDLAKIAAFVHAAKQALAPPLSRREGEFPRHRSAPSPPGRGPG